MKYILQLNKSINLNKIKKSIKNKNKNRPDQKKHFEEDQEVVYTILHEFSNYDEVIWSLYKTNNRKLIHNQLFQKYLMLLDYSLIFLAKALSNGI